MAYFLISVSNRTNLNLCMRYGLAGFTSSINGLWTFEEIQEGDYVSFLYGARVFNLYKVMKKEALRGADKLPPWPSVTFKMSGKTYYFPFRLHLEPVRDLNEPMVRPEFTYVAENLLLRGGYRKTHFQADQITLHAVSQMGELSNHLAEELKLNNYETFQPKLTWNKNLESLPEVFCFQELILQSIIRHYLSDVRELQDFFLKIGLNNLKGNDFEALGEKALPEGHVDIFIKDIQPIGISRKIIVEVKTGVARIEDIIQLKDYMRELGAECMAGALIAQKYSKKVLQKARDESILPLIYFFEGIDRQGVCLFEDLKRNLRLEVIEYDRSRG
jgi:hypothetical protein